MKVNKFIYLFILCPLNGPPALIYAIEMSNNNKIRIYPANDFLILLTLSI